VTRTRDRFFNYLHIRHPNGVYMHQRGPKDIWQGLFELPLIESERSLARRYLISETDRLFGTGWKVLAKSDEVKHVLSHQLIRAVFWEVVPPKGFKPPKEWIPLSEKALGTVAVPRLIERWLAIARS